MLYNESLSEWNKTEWSRMKSYFIPAVPTEPRASLSQHPAFFYSRFPQFKTLMHLVLPTSEVLSRGFCAPVNSVSVVMWGIRYFLYAVSENSYSGMMQNHELVLGFLDSQALGPVATWCPLTEREWLVPCHMALCWHRLWCHICHGTNTGTSALRSALLPLELACFQILAGSQF